MARGGAAAAGALLGAGSALLFATVVPHLPGGHLLARVGAADTRHAPLVALGLGLLLLGTLALLIARAAVVPGLRLSATLAAAAAPLAIGLLVAFRSGTALLSPQLASPEVDRLLAIGAAGALLVVPPTVWLALSPPLTPPAAGRSAAEASPRPAASERLTLATILAAFALVVGLGIAQAAPFSWDEAVYALTSRHWVQDGPSTGWGAHRPPVLSALGVLPLAFGTQEALFRLIGLAFGLGALVAVWLLARGLAAPWASRWTGPLAALTVAAAPSIQIDAGLFLNDVPAVALLVALIAMLWRVMERPGPVGWGLLWLAPVAAAAFYVRYGSILPLAAIGLAAAVIWPRRLLVVWPRVAVTAGLLLLLLVPHGIFAVTQTGSPIGVFLLAQGGASGAYLGAALVHYAAWLPAELVGPVPAAMAVAGLLGALYRLGLAARLRTWDRPTRATTLLLLPALLQFLVLGLLQLPQGRYLFLPMTLLIVAGSVVVLDGALARGAAGRSLAVGLATLVTVSLVVYGVVMPIRADARASFLAWKREAGQLIRELGDGDCSVLAADFPQMTWYSGCPTHGFAGGRFANRDRLLTGANRFMVLRRDGRFQPQGEVLAAYLSRVEPQPLATFENRSGQVVATLYRFR